MNEKIQDNFRLLALTAACVHLKIQFPMYSFDVSKSQKQIIGYIPFEKVDSFPNYDMIHTIDLIKSDMCESAIKKMQDKINLTQ
jgi:hypothetical protein